MRRLVGLASLACAILPCTLRAQNAPPPAQRPDRPAEGPKPYAQVITAEATTDSGVFIVHRLADKLYFEIPRAALERPFLLVARYSATPSGTRYAGEELNDRVVRWQRVGNRVLLRNVSYTVTADTTAPVSRAVQLSNFEPVIQSFSVAAYSPNADSNAVIEVTPLYTTDVPELSARRALRARRLDPARSLIERAVTFPTNVEVEALQTYEMPDSGGPGAGPFGGGESNSVSALIHYSMVLLPARLMKPRLCDNRVGYFSVSQSDYGTDEHRVAQKCYITRWRLEPKDPSAAVSDPVKPIVFYIDPATPAKWVPWLKKGIESWEPLFRAAGLSNAIQARMVPTAAEDPRFSLEDARYSSVRWLPSPIENAYGPHISDPRTGEILQTSIGFYHNVMNLVRDWYFVQVGPMDPRAKTLPLPDSLMGDFLAYVVAHEVGHTLGFPHNMKSSSSYPVDSLRSRTFTARYGDEASIMDYGRFNYVSQPGDGARLIPIQGPYDYFAINWGYRPLAAATPEAERPTLDSLARLQDRNPMLRFGNADGTDPEAQTEDLGSDPIAATTLGLRNLERVMPMLLPATTADRLKDYDDLNEMYDQVLGQWQRELGHVVTLVGGVYRAEHYPDQPGPIFTPAARARQQAAVAFLNDRAFHTPAFLLDQDVLRRVKQSGVVDQIGRAQTALLGALFNDSRMNRLVEQEAMATAAAPVYRLSDLLGDVRRGLFSELARAGAVEVYRRNLQRNFITLLTDKLGPTPPPPPAPPFPGFIPPAPRPDEARAMIRGELRDLDAAIATAIPRVTDRETRVHLQDLRFRIDQALHPKT